MKNAAFALLFVLLAAVPASGAKYVIGFRDILSVSVFGHEDLKQEVRVDEEGIIGLSLVGGVEAVGLTVDELEQKLAGLYGEYLQNPRVQAFVLEYHSKEVSVLGEVRTPGLYKLSGSTTLLEVISLTGGLGEDHAENIVVLREPKKDEPRVNILIDSRKLFTPEGQSLNIQIQDGDVIHVPRQEMETISFYINGQVRSPGAYQMPENVTMTVIKAVTLAGGFTNKASKRRIKIRREVGGQTMEFKVGLDTQVRAQDVIVVPESFF